MIPSANQLLASNPDASAWVMASAGTGKTRVLTDRVLRLLLSGVPLRRILCLTFTKTAAAEMSLRLQKTVSLWARLNDAELLTTLKALIGKAPDQTITNRARLLFTHLVDNPGDLHIQTIHAFCQSLIGRFPLEANIPPHFKVADDHTAHTLAEEALTRLFNSALPPELQAALSLLFQSFSDNTVTSLLRDAVQKREYLSMPEEEYTLALSRRFNLAQGTNILEAACDNAFFDCDALRYISKAMSESAEKNIKLGAIIAEWINESFEVRQQKWEYYISAFLTNEAQPRSLRFAKKIIDSYPELQARIAAEQQRILKLLDQLKSIEIIKLTEAFLHVFHAFLALYNDLKQKQALLDYDDLIIEADRLLSNPGIAPWIMYKLDGGIDHILVDEAQDTSPMQWQILEKLSAEFFAGESSGKQERTLFVVGDEKQSIFSFQGANLHIFQEVQRHFREGAKAARKPFHTIALEMSFRSTASVLKAVDATFANEAVRAHITGQTAPVHHEAHRLGSGGKVEIWPLIPASKREEKSEGWQLPEAPVARNTAPEILASMMADTIAGWLALKRILPSKARPIEPGDIMILLRKRAPFMAPLIRALQKHQLPVSGPDRLKLYSHMAVRDLMALGKFLLLPEDDLNLACVLKSPLIALNEEELFTISFGRDKKTLWQSLKEQTSPRLAQAYQELLVLLNHTDYQPPFEFYSNLINAQNGRQKFIAWMGAEVNDALDEFLQLACHFEQQQTPSLQGFLRWMAQSDKEVKRDIEQERNEIRIMTVHAAKGLQAPIVFLPDSAQILKNSFSNLMIDDGVALLVPSKAAINAYAEALLEREEAREYSEYLRQLYVAMTRAEDELYICGWEGGDKDGKSWYALARQGLKLLNETSECEVSGFDQKGLVLTNPQTLKLAEQNLKLKKLTAPLPSFAFQKAPFEAAPVAALNPSHLGHMLSPAKNSEAIEKGLLTHRLLELLPNLGVGKRADAGTRLISHYPHIQDREMILHQVLKLLVDPEFSHFFSEASVAEASISGKIGNQPITGQIDRLTVSEKDVWIIDYKTGAMPDTTPLPYLRQMAAYYRLMKEIYPDKAIHAALLWTESLTLAILSQEKLEAALTWAF